MIKISFDIDGTLFNNSSVQQLAKDLSKRKNIELWIHTRRKEKDPFENREVYELADIYDIPEERVIFTDGQYKFNFLDNNNINIHIDDDSAEMAFIPLGRPNIVQLCIYTGWKDRVLSYINRLQKYRNE